MAYVSGIMTFLLALLMIAAPAASDTSPPECRHDREEILALEFAAFDQAEDSGWRPLYRAGCYVEAAELLREWRRRNGNAQAIIPFHEAQMWAYAGHTARAEQLFAQTYRADGSVSAVTWNLYVDGNLAFLRRHRRGLEAAAAALANVPKPAGWDRAVGVDGKPISLPWPINLNVLEAMLRCWEETYEVAAHCHVPDWRQPDPADWQTEETGSGSD